MSLRGYRKDKEKNQTSILRFVRHSIPSSSSSNSPKSDGNNSRLENSVEENSEKTDISSSSPIIKSKFSEVSCKGVIVNKSSKSLSQVFMQKSSSNFINGCSATSPNKLESNPPQFSSKLFYVQPKDEETESSQSIVDPKESGIDISAVLKDKSSSASLNGLNSQDSATDSPQINASLLVNRKRRIDSDDDSSDSPTAKKTCLENGADDDSKNKVNGSSNAFSDEMIEKLLDTYEGLYSYIDRMEIYEIMQKWKFNLTEGCANLDSIQKQRKSKSKQSMMKLKFEEREKMKEEQRISRLEERNNSKDQVKVRRAIEMDRKKKVWKMKARYHEDEDNDEEDDYIGKSKVYLTDSSDDEDCNDKEELTPARAMVMNLFNEGSVSELTAVPGCSKKKVEIIMNARPFTSWTDIVYKFKNEKMVNAELLNSAKDVLQTRNSVQRLMKRCEKISSDINAIVSQIIDGQIEDEINKQPSILNPELKLKNYQLIGLNWLVLMHDQHLNGVLADEMGLGKTIQAISFLAHLKEKNELEENLSLIVVPTSTLDNWAREMDLWCPSLGYLVYHGSQEERRGMRMEIINGELEEGVHVILTTYNMVSSSSEDRGLFKKIKFHTVIFDEAHMLKNMASQRYENLMKIKCIRRLLLTGTPLQNNLVELMSILVFVMPQLFEGRKEELKKVFAMFPKAEGAENSGIYERERIIQAKRIMAPFFLRRLKEDVLKDLPQKLDEVLKVSMSERQLTIYQETVSALKKRAHEKKEELEEIKLQEIDEVSQLEAMNKSSAKKSESTMKEDSSSNMLMKLRKIANHPLLHRSLYTKEKINKIAKILKKTSHTTSVLEYIVEDLVYMSDFEIHQTCDMFGPTKKFCLTNEQILDSGKFKQLDEILPKMKLAGDRVLVFSQFVIMLNIIEEYMKIRGYAYKRLDGSTNVAERQDLIDDFNDDSEIFVFLLSTRAGGLGINLTAANVVVLHDIDFNPYNDKQAEDRCHRVGQTKTVHIYRYICSNSIEEGMHQIALNKLQLEKDVTGQQEDQKKKDVLYLLKTALGEA